VSINPYTITYPVYSHALLHVIIGREEIRSHKGTHIHACARPGKTIVVNADDMSIISRSTEFEGLGLFAEIYCSSTSQATERAISVRPARNMCKGIVSDQVLMAGGGFSHNSPQCVFRTQPDYTGRHNKYYKRFIIVSVR
jgi:hypothetical protein